MSSDGGWGVRASFLAPQENDERRKLTDSFVAQALLGCENSVVTSIRVNIIIPEG